MKKKVLASLLCASMVATMFAGCGSSNGNGTEKADKKDGGKPKNGGKRPPRNDNRHSRGPRVRKDNAPEEASADKKPAAPTEAPKKEE